MLWTGILLLAAAGAGGPRSDSAIVTIDSARHTIVIDAGPYRLPALAPGEHHEMMMPSPDGLAHDTPLDHFTWPIDGWLHGFRLEVAGDRGELLPRHFVHHLIVVNFSRRQLIYPAAERLLGAGAETDDATIPKTVGIPMSRGMQLGMYVAWHNDTGQDLDNVHIRLTLLWTPENQVPRPVSALPIYMDANLTVGGSNTFDIPPGRSSKAYEFTLPIGGRLLAVGGHLHQYGVGVQLEDAVREKTLARVSARRDSTGAITSVGRRLLAVSGDGLKLKQGRRYRITGSYDNPTGQMLSRSAMAHMVGLFAPDKLTQWPAIDLADRDYQRDLRSLQVQAEAHPNGHLTFMRHPMPVSR
jgi:hypothetical protein